jgi:predicted ATPase
VDDNFVLITGCSGGGKSTLLAELVSRGHHVVPEPGRRIVAAALAGEHDALPWVDPAGFVRRAIDMALADRDAAREWPGWVFFDRGLIDAASALEAVTGEPTGELLRTHRYHRQVFLAPPWPEIYETDRERRHGYEESLAEYERLSALLPQLGYAPVLLPKISVTERADFVLATLAEGHPVSE